MNTPTLEYTPGVEPSTDLSHIIGHGLAIPSGPRTECPMFRTGFFPCKCYNNGYDWG